MENLAIVRRMDTDGDAMLVYSEFAEFVRSAFPSPRPSTPPRPSSASRGASSPLKSRGSPVRASSANRTAGRNSSPVRGVSPSRTSPTRKPVLRVYDEDQLVHGLKDLCNLEQELESAKIALAQKHDFNLRDAFDIFDVPRYGQIDAYQLRSGLNAIGVYPSADEVDLFITRYDRDGNRRLSYHEFAEAFLARDGYYSSMVDRRPSNYTPRPIRRDDCFLPNTAFEFQNMWRTHIRVENQAESFRQRLSANPGFNCYEAFNSLDLTGTGGINAGDLKRMIESRGYFVGFKEVDAVVDKFDANKNGLISFSEFRDETLPKSPARR